MTALATNALKAVAAAEERIARREFTLVVIRWGDLWIDVAVWSTHPVGSRETAQDWARRRYGRGCEVNEVCPAGKYQREAWLAVRKGHHVG